MSDRSKILAGLPPSLRDELLQAYEAIASHFAEHRWEPSELNGEKFCEVVYSILNGAIVGPMPPRASKPRNMLAACQALAGRPADPNRAGDYSLRVLIPHVLIPLYDIRNHRSVGHVGGDVDPNFLDATAVYGMASWVLAELIRVFHSTSTQEAQQIVDALVERKHPLIWEIAGKRRILDASMPLKDQVLLLLHGSASWIGAKELTEWVEYSNVPNLRSQVLKPLHGKRLLEYDPKQDCARLSPLGAKDVEERILKSRTARS